MVFKDPLMLMKVSQGVTTVITGNCGISLAPLKGLGDDRELVPPFDLLGDPDDYHFDTLSEYIEYFGTKPAAVNSAMLTGHSTLRREAMDTLNRPASKVEIQYMCRRLEQALEDGSLGMSTGLSYPTAVAAQTTEVIELASVLAQYERVYTTHMRDEEERLLYALEETFQVGREAGVKVVISHHKVCGRRNWGLTRESIAMIDIARQTQSIELDVYPYTASSTILLLSLVEQAERVVITWSKSHPSFAGRDLTDIAEEWMCTIDVAVERLQPAGAIYHEMSPEDLERVMSYPPSMIGSDGLPSDEYPHPRLWGTFPRVLGHFARDLGLFSLEEAIHKMTGKTATVFGLQDRGYVKAGFFADLVLFDASKVIDRATYENPTAVSEGIKSVYVNGTLIYDETGVTGATPGRYLCN